MAQRETLERRDETVDAEAEDACDDDEAVDIGRLVIVLRRRDERSDAVKLDDELDQ